MARGGVDLLAGPDRNWRGAGSSNHAKSTEEVFRLIAPDRKLIFLPTGTSYSGGKYYHKLLTDAAPEIIAQSVDTLYASLSTTPVM